MEMENKHELVWRHGGAMPTVCGRKLREHHTSPSLDQIFSDIL